MSAVKPEAFDSALALGRGGSSATFVGHGTLQADEYVWLACNFIGAFRGYTAELGSVARARTPDDGYTGSWVVTLGPLVMETQELVAYKDPAPFAWDNVRLPKGRVSWGIGGAPFSAWVDWPLRGAAFGVSGDFVELTYGLLFDEAVGSAPSAAQYGQSWRVAGAVSPGQRSSIGAYGNPCYTFPSFDITVDENTASPYYPTPPFAVAVQLLYSDLVYPESANTLGKIEQYDQTGGIVRADLHQPLTAQTYSNGLFAIPLHPAAVAVRYYSGFPGQSDPSRQRLAFRFVLDLGAH